MTAAPPTSANRGSLPPLAGGLLWLYRIAWAGLMAAALAVLGFSAFDPGTASVILALRLVKAAIVMTVAVILFRRRQRDPVAAMLALAFLAWTITSSFDFTAADPAPVLLDRVRFLLFALALLLFPDGDWRPDWTRKVAAASAAVFLTGILEALGLLPTALFLPLAIGCVVAAVIALVIRFRTPSSEALRLQLKWVALGLSVGIALILAARAGAALQDRLPDSPVLLEALFQSGIVVLATGFLVSLLRYRLYDAEAVISRSAVYAVLTISLLTTFAASEGLIEVLGQRYFGSGIGDFSAAFAAAIAAVLLAPLHGRIDAWAERRFQRDLILLKEQLPELLGELAASSSTSRVGHAALPRIAEAVHASGAALVVDGTVVAAHGISQTKARRWVQDWQPLLSARLLDCDRDARFPLRMVLRCPFGGLRGWLLIGPRPDGSPYGKDDRDALAAIAAPLRQALFAAREREQELARERQANRATAIAIEQLQRRLDDLEQVTSARACRA